LRIVTHRRAFLAGALVCAAAAVCSTAPAAAQGLDPIVKTSTIPGGDFRQGGSMQVNLSIVPPADAPGDLTVLIDGLGARDGFVQKMFRSDFDCPLGGCGDGQRPTPCATGRACFLVFMQLDVRLPIGHHEFPITVTDTRGRRTRLSAGIDVRPWLDRDADGMPDAWEDFYNLSFQPAGGGPGDDPDGDGVPNLEEFRRGTNPRARYARYFAEGSSGDRAPGLEQCYTMASLSVEDFGQMWITLIGDDGRQLADTRNVHNNSVLLCPMDRREHPADRVVAVLVESEKPIVIERAATSTAPRYPTLDSIAFSTLGVAAPASHWLFADGGTDGVLDTFYLTYNPGPEPAEATFTYRTPAGAIARRRTVTLAPGVRTTTWVNVDDAARGRAEAWVDVTATSPILVERAWRFDPPGRTVTQASASPGTNDASSRWIFPEMDGQAAFDTTIVLANPSDREAVLDVNLLFADRAERQAGQVRVPARGRISVPARAILPDGRASVEIVSANGVRVAGERTVSGRDGTGAWRVAAIGAREPGSRWVLPSSTVGETIVTNVSPFPARVELHFYTSYSFGEDSVQTIDVPARGRVITPVAPLLLDTLRATSLPTDRGTAEIVVEGERYADGDGVARTRSSGALAARVP